MIDSSQNWFEKLKPILLPTMDLGTGAALIRHLADLGVYEYRGNQKWFLAVPNVCENRIVNLKNLNKFLVDLASRQEGFSISYFLAQPITIPEITEDNLDSNSMTDGISSNATSNLSNLQLVKKLGRQLSPFIELEGRLNNKFLGVHVDKKDARVLTNFVISILKEKESPRKWEQLSRKRHK